MAFKRKQGSIWLMCMVTCLSFVVAAIVVWRVPSSDVIEGLRTILVFVILTILAGLAMATVITLVRRWLTRSGD